MWNTPALVISTKQNIAQTWDGCWTCLCTINVNLMDHLVSLAKASVWVMTASETFSGAGRTSHLHVLVLRTCSDHSNEVFDDSYICYGGSMKYSREEYPHCKTDCEQRSLARCNSCMDTNLCTHSRLHPGKSCLACTNPHYFKCSGSCLHPDLVWWTCPV